MIRLFYLFASIFFFIMVCSFLIAAPAQAFMDRGTDCTNQPFSCFSNKYGFGANPKGYTFTAAQQQRMAEIKPFAVAATQVYNSIAGHDKVEPQMLVWWAIYDTGGTIEYSNCANISYTIANCNLPWFWQLGYGAQFNHVKDMTDGFSKLYGDPNNSSLVQQVGQAVINYDKSKGASPACGGNTCTFPTSTLNTIFSGIPDSVLARSPSDSTPISASLNYWWASVLLRDPALNAYNMADITNVDIINKNTICGWIGDYCKAWGGAMTNSLAQVVSMWNSIPSTGINLPGNPGSSATTDFAKQFSTPGGKYNNYYQFANTKLFDGVDFFSSSPTGGTGNKYADYANLLYKTMINTPGCWPKIADPYYGNIVRINLGNYQGCLNGLKASGQLGQYADQAIQQLRYSFTQAGFGTLSCVYFARAVASGVTGVSTGLGGLPYFATQSQTATSNQYFTAIYAKWQNGVHTIPGGVKPGDFYLSDYDAGHIGIITSVGPDSKGFGLTEANQKAGMVDMTPNINYVYDQYFFAVLRPK